MTRSWESIQVYSILPYEYASWCVHINMLADNNKLQTYLACYYTIFWSFRGRPTATEELSNDPERDQNIFGGCHLTKMLSQVLKIHSGDETCYHIILFCTKFEDF